MASSLNLVGPADDVLRFEYEDTIGQVGARWVLTRDSGRNRTSISETIDAAVRLLVEAARPQRIILFGSFARGEGGVDSDLDFVVILPTVENHFREMIRLRHALESIHMPIDVLVYSEDDLKTRGTWKGTALHEALHAGRVVYADG